MDARDYGSIPSLRSLIETRREYEYKLKHTRCSFTPHLLEDQCFPSLLCTFQRGLGVKEHWTLRGDQQAGILNGLSFILKLPDSWYTDVHIDANCWGARVQQQSIFESVLPHLRDRKVHFENVRIGPSDAVFLAQGGDRGAPIRVSFRYSHFELVNLTAETGTEIAFVGELGNRDGISLSYFEWNGEFDNLICLLQHLQNHKSIATLRLQGEKVPGALVSRARVDRLIIDPASVDDEGSTLLEASMEGSDASFKALHLVQTSHSTPTLVPLLFDRMSQLRLEEVGIGVEVTLRMAKSFYKEFPKSNIRVLRFLPEAEIALDSWRVIMEGILESKSAEKVEVNFMRAKEKHHAHYLVQMLKKNRRLELEGLVADPECGNKDVKRVLSLNHFICGTEESRELSPGLALHSLVIHRDDLARTGVMVAKSLHVIAESIAEAASCTRIGG